VKGRDILWIGLSALPLLVPAWLARRAGFDGLYGQDAYAYFDYAVGPLAAALRAAQPPPPFFWPPGYPLVVALAAEVVGPHPQVAQTISWVAAVLTVGFTALLAAELWPWPSWRRTGMVMTALLTACVGQLWQSSVVVMADTTGLAAATAGMWALVRYDRQAQPRRGLWLLLASACLALALLTRWAYALVALVAALWTLGRLWRQPWPVLGRQVGPALLVAVLLLAPLWWAWLRGTVDPVSGHLAFAGNWQVYSWSPRHAWQREFVTPDGLLRYRWPNGLWYAGAPAHRYFFTVLLAPFLAVGLVTAVRPWRRDPRLLLLPAWAGVVWGFHAGAAWQNFRFNLAHLPALAVLTSLGIVTAARGCRRLADARVARFAMGVLALWVLGGLLLMARGGWVLTATFIARKNADVATVREVEARLPAGARVLTFNLTPTFRHYGRLEVADLYALSAAALDAYVAEGRPLYLLLDQGNVESQWQGRAPALHYQRLRAEPGLVPLGRYGPYTLWCVGGVERCGSP
jgi:4-amino-4-deoxy-L-arabinose transferase-like glycosyltransferase